MGARIDVDPGDGAEAKWVEDELVFAFRRSPDRCRACANDCVGPGERVQHAARHPTILVRFGEADGGAVASGPRKAESKRVPFA